MEVNVLLRVLRIVAFVCVLRLHSGEAECPTFGLVGSEGRESVIGLGPRAKEGKAVDRVIAGREDHARPSLGIMALAEAEGSPSKAR
jgi:hypothetical protein